MATCCTRIRDRYEAGQQVRLVGYTQAQARSTVDGRAVAEVQRNGPYYAYLRLDPAAVERDAPQEVGPWPYVHPTDRRMGQVTIDEITPAAGPNYSLRVAAAFWLPRDLAPDVYDVTICNEPCTMTLGWLYGSPVNVGIDPADPIVRLWPLDDPAIRFLGDDALVAAPVCQADCNGIDDWSVTAAEIRRLPAPAVTVPPEPTRWRAPRPAPPASRPVSGAGQVAGGNGRHRSRRRCPERDRRLGDGLRGAGGRVVPGLALAAAGARMVVRQGNGQHDHGSSDDDPDAVHIKL